MEKSMSALWRVNVGGKDRLARGTAADGPQVILPEDWSLEGLLTLPAGVFAERLRDASGDRVQASPRVLAPVTDQEIWAAGVTYERSRVARGEESRLPDQYDRVYEAERPEIFFKCAGRRVRACGEAVGIRADSTWDVPEPELALIINCSGDIVAYTIGNDMSSRSIEGENALYLPQAKYYIGSCAIGPCLVPIEDAPSIRDMFIKLTIVRSARVMFEDSVAVSRMKRSPQELSDWLFRAQEFPEGVVLLTGTGLVPGHDFTLEAGDEVTIGITGLGELHNTVERVGRAHRKLR
jgi:2-dehydro-3-deoxy-D-arabinonate dehydratase